MNLPVYTELSNFSVRKGGKRVSTDLTIVLIINKNSDPISAINSINHFMNKYNNKMEFILINIDKEGYKYEKLLSTFPVMRVLLPQERITVSTAIQLAVTESLSKHILFVDDSIEIKSADFEVLNMYLSEGNYGLILPHIQNGKEESVENIVKGGVADGFINTISRDIIGTAVTSIYPKYFAFIMNKEMWQSREIILHNYEDVQYTLLEMGFKIWKEGFVIIQVRNLKVQLNTPLKNDIVMDLNHYDYLHFNFYNLTSPEVIRERDKKLFWILVKSFLTFRFKFLGLILDFKRNSKKINREKNQKPVEDLAIFSIINKDMK